MEQITFLIVTQDDENNTAECIETLKDLNVLVIDGDSNDNTVTTCRSLGASVIQNPFLYYAQQCNFGIKKIETPWVFIIDSDERLTPELRAELKSLDLESTSAGFLVKRINYFGRHRIRWGALAPDWNIRLFKVEEGVFEDSLVHPRVILRSKLKKLKSPLLHFSYRNAEDYIRRLNNYTNLELRSKRSDRKDLLAEKRSRIKRILFKLPFQSTLIFIYYYLIRLGFLHGKLGFNLSISAAYYRLVIKWKNSEN